MQSAPKVESGEVSTRWEPTLIAEMMEIASPPVKFYQTRSHRQEHRHNYTRGAGVCRQNSRYEGCPEADSGRASYGGHNLNKEVQATGFIHNVDQYGYAANHHDYGPRHYFNSSFGIAVTGEHEYNRKYEGNRTYVRKHIGEHFRQSAFNTRQHRNYYQKNEECNHQQSGGLCSVERFRFRSQFINIKSSAFLFADPISNHPLQRSRRC